jgi:hypothetical protein
MDRSFEPAAVTGRILLSAFIGIIVATIFLLCEHYLTQIEFKQFEQQHFLNNLEQTIKLFPSISIFGLLISSPLIAISIFFGILFRNSIQKYLLPWCCAAPTSVWSFVAIIFAGSSNFHEEYSFFYRF